MRDAGFVNIQAARFKWAFNEDNERFINSLADVARISISLGGIDGVRCWEDAEVMLKGCEEEMREQPWYMTIVVDRSSPALAPSSEG
jgi:hypothetical protein